MRPSWVWYLCGVGVFAAQQMGTALGILPPWDYLLILILWRVYGEPLRASLIAFVLLWAIVVDTFSSLLPGPAILAYLVGVFLLNYFRWRFSPWVRPARILSVFFTYVVAEVLRLYIVPAVLDITLPHDNLYPTLEVFGGAVFCVLIFEAVSLVDLSVR